MIQAGSRTTCCEIHELIISIWNKEKLPEELKESNILPTIRRVIKQTGAITGAYQFAKYIQNVFQHPAVKDNSIHRGNY
jgi:hypothetical protein